MNFQIRRPTVTALHVHRIVAPLRIWYSILTRIPPPIFFLYLPPNLTD